MCLCIKSIFGGFPVPSIDAGTSAGCQVQYAHLGQFENLENPAVNNFVVLVRREQEKNIFGLEC